MFHFGPPNFTDLKIWEQLDPHKNPLTSLRLAKAREDTRKRLEAETRAIYRDNRDNSNSMAIPDAILKLQLKNADEIAEQEYAIFRDVWLQLGGVESAAFIRTISWKVIQPPFTARGASFAHQEQMRRRRTGGLRPVIPHVEICTALDSLKHQWREKLEIKALEWEAQAHGSVLTTALRRNTVGSTTVQMKPAARGKRATRPKTPCFESAIEQLRKNSGLKLLEFCQLMDRKADQFRRTQKYLPPTSWGVRSFCEQHKKRSNTVSRFLSEVRKAINSERG